MKYISYATTVDSSFTQSELSDLVSTVLSLNQIQDQISELLVAVTGSKNTIKKEIESRMSEIGYDRVSVSIIESDKLAKKYTTPTLIVDAFEGDYLVYTRSAEHLRYFVDDNKSIGNHLDWIQDLNGTQHPITKSYYQELNQAYGQTIIPLEAVGFVISRQVANSIDSSEFDYYDVFSALATSSYSGPANTELIDCPSAHGSKLKQVYSKSDKLELLTKFLDLNVLPYYLPNHPLFLVDVLVFVVACVTMLSTGDMIQSIPVIVSAITAFYMINDAANRKTTIIAKQTFAAANKKKIAGRYLKTIVNTKKN